MDIAALIAAARGRSVGAAESIAVAVSGGPDSIALLALCAAAFPGRITALTVDHRLRAGSDCEAAIVADQCAVRGIAHVTLPWVGPKTGGNIQAAARAARYRLLADWCTANGAALLLTAHHADDQAETLLMRLNRGSGNGGLAGIRPRRWLASRVELVRPLLGQRRAALTAFAAAGGWTTVHDPSNQDDRYDRTAARKLLAAGNWLDVAAVARSAAHLQAAEQALAWAADLAWAGNIRRVGDAMLFDAGVLPSEIRLRILRRILAELAPAACPRGSDVAAWLARLEAGKIATLAGVQGRIGSSWRFVPVPVHRVSR